MTFLNVGFGGGRWWQNDVKKGWVRRWAVWGDGGSDPLGRGLAKACVSELIRVKMTKRKVAVAKKVMEAILPFAICYCLSF